jgi:hypothetical protein
MALLTAAMIAGFVFLTMLSNEIGMPALLTALVPIPLTFVGGFVLSRIMRVAGMI